MKETSDFVYRQPLIARDPAIQRDPSNTTLETISDVISNIDEVLEVITDSGRRQRRPIVRQRRQQPLVKKSGFPWGTALLAAVGGAGVLYMSSQYFSELQEEED